MGGLEPRLSLSVNWLTGICWSSPERVVLRDKLSEPGGCRATIAVDAQSDPRRSPTRASQA